MFKNCLIIMPFNIPWNRAADFQWQTCQVLNRHNLIVAYMHHHAHFFLKKRQVKYPQVKNVLFFTPKYLIPFRRFAAIEKLNQILNIFYLALKYGRGRSRVILWIFDPLFHFYPKTGRRIISLYDCVDYHFSRRKRENKTIRQNEVKLIRNCTFFFVNSQILQKVHKPIRKAIIVPQGFALSDFKNYEKRNKIILPQDKPIIGCIGSLDFRLDWELLFKLISRNQQWTFAFWGPHQTMETKLDSSTEKKIKTIFAQKNVFYGGDVNRKSLRSIIRQFDAGIIPYDISYDMNRYCFPMKLFEYFYLGKPVVATSIEELKRFSRFVKIGKSVEEWQRLLTELLSSPWPKKYQLAQKRMAQSNSWDKKIESMANHMMKFEVI